MNKLIVLIVLIVVLAVPAFSSRVGYGPSRSEVVQTWQWFKANIETDGLQDTQDNVAAQLTIAYYAQRPEQWPKQKRR
ncbi:hypothetical protein ACFLZ2_05470 [Candidatus Margulisiibacteriota bacterium]